LVGTCGQVRNCHCRSLHDGRCGERRANGNLNSKSDGLLPTGVRRAQNSDSGGYKNYQGQWECDFLGS